MLMHYLHILFFSMGFLFSTIGQSQDIAIGSWKDHLSYKEAIAVTYGNGKIYCASESALFSYNIEDGELERLNLVNGLSDIGISDVKFNSSTQKLLVAYSNGNLDIINSDNEITNLAFIKNSNIVGNKGVNQIYMEGAKAYLSTGFGIVVLNLNKDEVFDTYMFGDNGQNIITNAITFDSQNIYAATEEGVYSASKNSNNLADYNEWSFIPELGIYNYSDIVSYQNLLFVGKQSDSWQGDSVLYNPNGMWQAFLPIGVNISHISSQQNKLIVAGNGKVRVYDESLAEDIVYYTFMNQFGININDVYLSGTHTWMADASAGLIRYFDTWNGEVIFPNGPSTSSCYKIDVQDKKLWMGSGTPGAFNSQNVYNFYKDYEWQPTNKVLTDSETGKNINDVVSVAIDPLNSDHVYMGSWNRGLLEFNNGNLSNVYRAQNSPLDSVFYGVTVVASMDFDNDNNLWITSSYSSSVVSVKISSGEWYNMSLQGKTNDLSYYPHMIVDANKIVWILDKKFNKVIALDANDTYDDDSDDLVASSEQILAGGYEVHTFEEDLNGELWFGTDKGVGVISAPADIFTNAQSIDPIYIQQDGQTQLLLETETVTSLAIDGANRKWIGTQGSGVYLMSEDGKEEVFHFTNENSPLLSNNILDISIDHTNGEVYFATEKGLISYKSTATGNNDDFSNVLVYPNPVREDYSGMIAIKGLTRDTDVRITDVSGNLVFQTQSIGGQAIWDGNDLNGNRVQTGVYMVFSAGSEGTLKNAAKILFIN